LACVLAGQAFFGVLLSVYGLCALWSLALFYLQREQQVAEGSSPTRQAVKSSAFVPWSSLGLWPAARWGAATLALGLPLFLLLPRGGEARWDPFRLLAGNAPKQAGVELGIDLARTGLVQLSEEVAFEVKVRDANGPKRDLDSEQYWRGETLDTYHVGRWQA